MSSTIRVKFVRGEEVKYISHLDLMKVFDRAIRRARLPIAYSQGFNPHPRMVFGLPLSVGVTSEAEYADFELSKEMQPEDFMVSLNTQLPAGLKIVSAFIRKSKSNIMADIKGAAYKVLVCADDLPDSVSIEKMIDDFLANPEIIAKKETKSGVKEVNIRPMINKMGLEFLGTERILSAPEGYINPYIKNYLLIIEQNSAYYTKCSRDRIMSFDLVLSAGSQANLKPELLFASFSDFTGLKFQIIKVHRTDLFVGSDKQNCPYGEKQSH